MGHPFQLREHLAHRPGVTADVYEVSTELVEVVLNLLVGIVHDQVFQLFRTLTLRFQNDEIVVDDHVKDRVGEIGRAGTADATTPRRNPGA
jgi:hypothetical protein